MYSVTNGALRSAHAFVWLDVDGFARALSNTPWFDADRRAIMAVLFNWLWEMHRYG